MKNTSGLKHQIYSEPEKKQLESVSQLLKEGETGLDVLMDWMVSVDKESSNLALGKAYQALYANKAPQVENFLQHNFPDGIVPLKSDRGIDYSPLQKLLAQSDFQSADVMTLQKLCELAGTAAVERNWVYFTEIESFPVADLRTLDKLWLMYSEGKFGFSIQRKIWLSVGKDFAKLWSKINWKSGNTWTRYPKEFTWDTSAPEGHLPLSNQLRGVRTIDAIFAHPAWKKD
ncbi:GUN4 N-terminal ARM-like repeat domain-containing protein [Waterburya agarophytonicola K14]|uniref:GUN4 N-terminal ARM-like repeat domain-containing protein n=1 Tax=Waterburya agarophytonicola KI4 TaxID=2874699 RepID=A0A964FG76_9CYAN|nr:GUN4 domain-containing protein [Waterburya agarophytonicola]MCC0177701.1 GUN4 N-terminal ARM-like repeat domain-containing protein [Waterburya agarophytonicola KI4]